MSEATLAIPTDAVLADVALSRGEYELANSMLGRPMTDVELGIVGALWSEHCGYKTSKTLLRRLPTTGPGVLQGPGENAGAVDIGDGLACVFKIELHNHPSAIEPYEGAATGVGGIVRDIFTMGARPIALLDSLRFGPLEEPAQRRLFDGVVAGIGGYGNCLGIPTVGGEVYFHESYRHNCLVNAMCVGVIEHKKLTRAVAAGVGNPVLLVGADTGRDGIHGATFASVAMDEDSEERRPAVQVGNPFLEKCLMEACLELAGDPRIVAMQDLGAAGLTSSTAELAHRGGCGIDINIDAVARRETGMTPYEVMLSESQERMLIVCDAGTEDAIAEAFLKWDLHSDVIGTITDTGKLVVRSSGVAVAELPLDMLIDDVPLRSYDVPPMAEPAPFSLPTITELPSALLLQLLGHPNIGSRRPVFRRYDHQVGNDTIIPPGSDAAVVRVNGTDRGLALATDCNGHYVALNPRRGAQIAVCEAARNVVATGARPLAVTNCLNFGNPETPRIYGQLHAAIEGLSEACEALGVPVVSGNVSLYNDTLGVSIDPTPVIGMVGVIDDVERRLPMAFRRDNLPIYLVGDHATDLQGSQLAQLAGATGGDAPELDLAHEVAVQQFILTAHGQDLLASAHDCSDGGLAVALTEACLAGDRGCSVRIGGTGESDGASILFGERQSRFVITCTPQMEDRLVTEAAASAIPLHRLGVTGGSRIVIGDIDVDLEAAAAAFDGALGR